jgi:hypothetical protein
MSKNNQYYRTQQAMAAVLNQGAVGKMDYLQLKLVFPSLNDCAMSAGDQALRWEYLRAGGTTSKVFFTITGDTEPRGSSVIGGASVRLIVCNEADYAVSLAQTYIIGQKSALENWGWFIGAETTDIVFISKFYDVNNLRREK